MKFNNEKLNYYKSLFKGYNYFVRQINYLKGRLQTIDELLTRIATPSISKTGAGVVNPIELMDEQQILQKELEIFQHHIKKVDEFMMKIQKQYAEIIKRIYMDGEKISNVCIDYFYCERQLKYIVDKIIDEYSNDF